MTSLRKLWAKITAELLAARAALGEADDGAFADPSPEQPLGTLADFREMLDHNELELAWDALEAVGERESANALSGLTWPMPLASWA